MNIPQITVTDSALSYLGKLVEQEGCRELRIGIQNPGTETSRCFLSFASQVESSDSVLEFDAFQIRFEASHAPFLQDMKIDYLENRYGGQVRLKTPYLTRMEAFPEQGDLLMKVNWVLRTHVNPTLSEHQGNVLADRAEGSRVWVKFGGNCLGCGHAEATLANFVEAELKKHLPNIEAVIDATTH